MDKREVTVKIIRVAEEHQLSPDDHELPLEVQIEIDGSVDDELLADAALDIFHDNIAVDCLDDFVFEVWFEGEQLTPKEDHDSYSLSQSGSVM